MSASHFFCLSVVRKYLKKYTTISIVDVDVGTHSLAVDLDSQFVCNEWIREQNKQEFKMISRHFRRPIYENTDFVATQEVAITPPPDDTPTIQNGSSSPAYVDEMAAGPSSAIQNGSSSRTYVIPVGQSLSGTSSRVNQNSPSNLNPAPVGQYFPRLVMNEQDGCRNAVTTHNPIPTTLIIQHTKKDVIAGVMSNEDLDANRFMEPKVIPRHPRKYRQIRQYNTSSSGSESQAHNCGRIRHPRQFVDTRYNKQLPFFPQSLACREGQYKRPRTRLHPVYSGHRYSGTQNIPQKFAPQFRVRDRKYVTSERASSIYTYRRSVSI